MLFVLFFTVGFLFAQDSTAVGSGGVEEMSASLKDVFAFFAATVIGSLASLFADAKKWIGSGQWDWSVFRDTKIKPFLFSLVGSIVLYFLLYYLPMLKPVVEALSGVSLLEITAGALMMAATALIDGFMKPTVKGVE